ncbi:type IV toxin-antitoxin system AbiEi family antitoxin domain-containing protein [Nocardioides sp. MH1]|uniref:type IV toxin-antitoxin system AbiEi family antitoxin domain-containing protein n=1 Tax=Nocardioides sp. MH1 TaxID=3242490 RepID=UPI003522995C
MDPRVIAAFGTHGGVLSRNQLLDLGVAPSEIRRMVRQGHWVRVRRGVYTTTAIWEAEDEYVGRPRLRSRAAILMMRRGWVLSHDSAAHEHGMPILYRPLHHVHVTRPGFTNAWTENGVKHHLARFSEQQRIVVDGRPALDPARTAVDIARERGLKDGLVACDAAMRMGVARSALQVAVEPMENWPGSRAARASVSLADPGAANVLESLGRELVLEAGIGDPETQFPVRTSEGVKWCDIRVGNHIIETDGRVKVLPAGGGGVATKPAADVLWDERKRERLVRDRRLLVTRLYWEDHWGDRRLAALRRLRADHAESVALYGAALDPRLAREAVGSARHGADVVRRSRAPRLPRRWVCSLGAVTGHYADRADRAPRERTQH